MLCWLVFLLIGFAVAPAIQKKNGWPKWRSILAGMGGCLLAYFAFALVLSAFQ
jgi:hypothetical protein